MYRPQSHGWSYHPFVGQFGGWERNRGLDEKVCRDKRKGGGRWFAFLLTTEGRQLHQSAHATRDEAMQALDRLPHVA